MMRRLPGVARPIAMFGAIGATLIGLMVGSGAWAETYGRRHEAWNWSGTIASGATLAIHGVNGEIVAEPGTGDKVEVSADKSARRHDPAEVTIKVVQDSDGITICAIYPGGNSPCEPSQHTWFKKDTDVEVAFHVKVPAGVTFEASTVNGAVRTRSLAGPVKARTVNGECDIETSKSGEASTVNGSVHAVLGKVGADDALAFSTVNGSITLRLPTGLDADLAATTVNGQIESDFPVTVSGKWGPRSMHGTIGRGGTKLTASTVNGGIKFEKSERSSAQ